jgi:hypothetical protein
MPIRRQGEILILVPPELRRFGEWAAGPISNGTFGVIRTGPLVVVFTGKTDMPGEVDIQFIRPGNRAVTDHAIIHGLRMMMTSEHKGANDDDSNAAMDCGGTGCLCRVRWDASGSRSDVWRGIA